MFTFQADPTEVIDERTRQFVACGIPARYVATARSRIDDMWGMGERGWVPVWGKLAEHADTSGDPLLASLCWGAARFPCLATGGRRFAHEQQLERYLAAAPRFRARFRRQVHTLPWQDGTAEIPVHYFQRPNRRPGGRPRGVLLLSGGVDTGKMELHRLAVTTALATGLLVAAIDMPGTGESDVPLSPGIDLLLAALVERLRAEHGAPVAFWGISFGGHWSAKLAMLGQVDAAVDLGGPTGVAADRTDILDLPYGMPGIIGNALRLDAPPTPDQVDVQLKAFSLRAQGLLERPGRAPLLALNGFDDQYIPRGDTTGLAGAPGTTTWLVRGATHCAPERFRPVAVAIWGWLAARMAPDSPTAALAESASRLPLTPLLARA
jgi:esterase FrsA